MEDLIRVHLPQLRDDASGASTSGRPGNLPESTSSLYCSRADHFAKNWQLYSCEPYKSSSYNLRKKKTGSTTLSGRGRAVREALARAGDAAGLARAGGAGGAGKGGRCGGAGEDGAGGAGGAAAPARAVREALVGGAGGRGRKEEAAARGEAEVGTEP
ncbi:hypothetical protein GUJ93_ZPchr0003g16925 [Zizania palustris]|uniref:Uncharacterized protein n=1 Tax=Zizania palustris TaxID=103762 RepID=A0A8J5S1Y1_ZIZPA|nr:hypothetical protein GUJ93_ZPchr0003g16925 [Zizania palustris]